MKELKYYEVKNGEFHATFLGSDLIEEGDFVWLTGPTGKPLLKFPKGCVTIINRKDFERRLMEDVLYKKLEKQNEQSN